MLERNIQLRKSSIKQRLTFKIYFKKGVSSWMQMPDVKFTWKDIWRNKMPEGIGFISDVDLKSFILRITG